MLDCNTYLYKSSLLNYGHSETKLTPTLRLDMISLILCKARKLVALLLKGANEVTACVEMHVASHLFSKWDKG